MIEKLGTVTIAPEVLATIAALTTLTTPGVARLNPKWSGGFGRLFHTSDTPEGVSVEIEEDEITLNLFIIVEPDTNMLRLSRRIQSEVSRAIQDIVGMSVKEINVHIEDVAIGK